MSLFFPSILNEKRWTLLAILSAFVLAVYISTGSNVARINGPSTEYITDYSSSFQKALKEQLERQNNNILSQQALNQAQAQAQSQALPSSQLQSQPQSTNVNDLLANSQIQQQQNLGLPSQNLGQNAASIQAPSQSYDGQRAAPQLQANIANLQQVQNLNQNSQISSNNLGYWSFLGSQKSEVILFN